ncbi:MAG TPA: PAS domain-containing protein [Xanthobacteraceae bacterium]
MKTVFMVLSGVIESRVVQDHIEPTAFPVRSKYILGKDVPLEDGAIPCGTKLTVEEHDFDSGYVCFDLDQPVAALGGFLEIMPFFGCDDVLAAINAGQRRLRTLWLQSRNWEMNITSVKTKLLELPAPKEVLSWCSRPDGHMEAHSPGWVRYFGLSLEESLVGWKRLLHHDDISAHIERWLRALRTGEPYVSEARYRCADGEYRPIIVRANPLRDKRGQIVKWHGMNALAG